MKRAALLLSLSVAGTATAAFAQGSFEGIVTYTSEKNSAFTYYAKGGKARIEPNDPDSKGMAVLMDGKQFTMVMPPRKMYMSFPFDPNASHAADTARGKVTKIGSETVAGVPCDDYQAVDAQGQKQETFCLAHGMGNFIWGNTSNNLLARMAPHISGLSEAISGGAFPLKAVNKEGKTTLLATKIEKKSLDDALFTVPAGYTQMTMPAGMMPQH